MKCPKCNHENREGARFCEECGLKLSLLCPKCGLELRPGARFCDECDTRVAETATDTIIPKLEDMHAQLRSLEPVQSYLSSEDLTSVENRPVTALLPSQKLLISRK